MVPHHRPTSSHKLAVSFFMHESNLVSSAQLKQAGDDPAIKILDCSWYLPNQQRDAYAEFQQAHIPGAVFFDIDQICDQSSGLPHMLPTSELFAAEVSKLGISNASSVIVYDGSGLFSAARVWWMFKVFGHHDVKVLDGGLPAWRRDDGALSHQDAQKSVVRNRFAATFKGRYVATKQDIIDNLSTNTAVVVDARSAARFSGQAPESRPELKSGHMPNAISLPFEVLLRDGSLKPMTELREIFSNLNLDSSSKIVTSCGSGVTAAIITLALAEAGYGLQRLYDGAWVEWASDSALPIVSS